MQPENGINILSWFENPSDRELLLIEPILSSWVTNQVPDVREAIKAHFKQTRPTLALGPVPKQRRAVYDSPLGKQRHQNKLNI